MTMTETVLITDDTVKAAAFSRLPEEEWEVLCSDEHVEAFHTRAKVLLSDLQGQLAVMRYKAEAGEFVDFGKRKSLGRLFHKVEALAVYLRPLVIEQSRRSAQTTYLTAIRLHKETTIAEYEPTPADVELWAVLGGGQA